MMRRAALLLLLAGGVWAEGPQYGGYDKNSSLEFENVYNDIRNPQITNGRAASFTATSLTVSTTTISSATITNLTVTTLTGFSQNVQQITGACTTGSTSNATLTFADTGLSISITPRATTDKILVIVSADGFDNTGAFLSYVTIARGGTDLLSGNGGVGFARNPFAGTNSNNTNGSFVYIDAPASVSSLTYTTQVKTSNVGGSARSNSQGHTQCIVVVDFVP